MIYYALFGYILMDFGLTFVWPSYRVWKQTGIFPVTFSNKDTAHDYIGNVFKMLLGLLLITGSMYAFYQQGVKYLLPVWYLEKPVFQIVGSVILFVALLWIAVAQHQMSNSWRIGIDEKNKTKLVTVGIFSISRNPIFLGMLCTLLGLFLVIPNAITFMVLVTGVIIIQVQIRLEEEFLEEQHGQDYREYCSKTKRWIW
ncbi:MAG TPA: isoprenylcysteine carboxylmethyltransferase family protein [Haliscomenobacter sp.]|uniref:methyltransferase family protein n=1 Tax=Haliscomenobacter sp. TaxID=2717303 RepID=UPI002D1B1884|nr:isoprenylcysteine carboxylmethyltransferase family protein [Haliscomenobacter sp.]HOY17628.1 isoprenylcysteine carboxylmethyltransferase family protein [Haliscomenobacter sp.]HPH19002.1 isoprenylcysteine carboxylmethyltransferase family protein [Haliscomenobacter sp.]